MVRVENVGAIFVACTVTSFCSKHVDITYQSTSEHVEDSMAKIVFVKSADDVYDILTKNLMSFIELLTEKLE